MFQFVLSNVIHQSFSGTAQSSFGSLGFHFPIRIDFSSIRELFFHRPPVEPKLSLLDTVLDVSGTSGLDTNGSDFDILREAVIATDLGSALDADGADLTVFAPTDSAFITLAQDLGADISNTDEQGALDSILNALTDLSGGDATKGTELLKTILLSHVKSGSDNAATLNAEGTVTTLSGADITISNNTIQDGEPDILNASFVPGRTDIEASNGTIQVIDRVILPIDIPGNTPPTLLDTVINVSGSSGLDDNGNDFDILREAVIATDLTGPLADINANLTVFAPTDSAFIRLAQNLGADVADGDEQAALDGIVNAVTGLANGDADAGLALLKDILLSHVAGSKKTLNDLTQEKSIETLSGFKAKIEGNSIIDAEKDLEDASFVSNGTDILGSNGIIHTIDKVIIPLDIPGNDVNVIEGNAGNNFLRGSSDDDAIFGNAGRDTILGRHGDDVLNGGNGNDRLFGQNGDDSLNGGNGHDTLRGGRGDDNLNGGNGHDNLYGGRGADELTGGTGKDMFVIDRIISQDDIDRVLDFTSGQDTLNISRWQDVTSMNDVNISVGNGETSISSGHNEVRLAGELQLEADDFIF